MVLARHIHHVHKPYHAHHHNQMHVHVIMHDLPHSPHSTYATMHVHVYMHVHVIQPRYKPELSIQQSKHLKHAILLT